ncbi:Uncharacterised protein [Acinetobacter baumannii]|nr:Uncharacterised protein [Acinetobacter baumannii]
MLWWLNTSRRVKASPASRAMTCIWIRRMESPPTWKKLSLMPIAGRFSTLFQISSRAASVALAGASRVCAAASAASAANSARRSSLPSAVSGRRSTRAIRLGSM